MIHYHTGPEPLHHQQLNAYLANEKQKDPNFKVIDIGGACCSRFWGHTDYIFDWRKPFCCLPATKNNPYTQFNISFLQGNILVDQDWEQVEQLVKDNGKFDFAICSHTIEDLSDPTRLLNKLPSIAKNGYIAVPSKESEIKKAYHLDRPNFMGCGHHFWIYVIYKGKLYGLPKMNWLETLTEVELINVDTRLGGSGATHCVLSKQELAIYWEEAIDVSHLIPVHWRDLPDDIFVDDPVLAKIYEEHKTPWDIWKHMLNNSE
jgi:hypothetical protein